MKNLQHLGKTLNKVEQRAINGGKEVCYTSADCKNGAACIIPPGCSSGFCDARIPIGPSL